MNESINQKLQKCKRKVALNGLIGVAGLSLGGLVIYDSNISLATGLLAVPLLMTGSVIGITNSLDEYESLKENLDNNKSIAKKR